METKKTATDLGVPSDSIHDRTLHGVYRAIRYLHRTGILPRGHSWLARMFASLVPSTSVVQAQIPGIGSLWVDLSDRGQCAYFLESGLLRERLDSAILISGARSFNVVFDLGAHIGYYSSLLWKWAPRAAVHAFEPSEQTFKMLWKNLGDRSRITLNQKAVSQITGAQPFYVYDCSDQSSLVRTGNKSVTVETITVDDYCSGQSIRQVDFIKCDVEGAELEVVSGAKLVLGSQAPPIWLIENSTGIRRNRGISQKEIARAFRTYSSQPLDFFSAQSNGSKVQLFPCDPDRVSWDEAGVNIWVVPQNWKATFLAMVSQATLNSITGHEGSL